VDTNIYFTETFITSSFEIHPILSDEEIPMPVFKDLYILILEGSFYHILPINTCYIALTFEVILAVAMYFGAFVIFIIPTHMLLHCLVISLLSKKTTK
jgi:hypothetical protein